MRRNLTVLLVVLAACGTAFAYTEFNQVPPGTQPIGSGSGFFNTPAPTAITYYSDEGDFLANAGSVVNELFLDSSAEPSGVCAGGGSDLNSATNDACFAAGAVIDGFTLTAIPVGDGTGVYVVLGTNFLGQPLPAVGPNSFGDDMELTFDPGANSVGFVLYGDLITTVDVDISIYDDTGAFIDAINVNGSAGGTFVGMVSDDPIGLMTFNEPAGGGELIANLYFSGMGGDGGGGDGSTGTPATSTWGVILLIALFMGISLFFLRRRANA